MLLANVSVFTFLLALKISEARHINKQWDLLIFTQHWPISVCVHYKEELSYNERSCILPKDNSWTIHGVWPTKLHTHGPEFCDKSLKFNETMLESIEHDLLNYWPNIEGGQSKSSLWKHEWEKHGTCAAVLEALDDERKYFMFGLDLFKQYNMSSILNKHSILPSKTNELDVNELLQVVNNATGKHAHIQCIIEKTSKKAYLFEVRICFNKKLELVDCDGIESHPDNKFFSTEATNCPLNSTIVYPSSLPTEKSHENLIRSYNFQNLNEAKRKNREYYRRIFNLLRVVQWLIL